MSDVKLGQLIEGEAERDCIHIALAPVVAGENLEPGAHVGLMPDGRAGLIGGVLKPLGIVDPFLQSIVLEGHKFWLCLYQNTVTGMRHQWAHPSFVESALPPRSGYDESKRWLTDFARSVTLDYGRIMDIADKWVEHSAFFGPSYDYDHYDVPDEFWSHYERITGKIVPQLKRQSFFSCCC